MRNRVRVSDEYSNSFEVRVGVYQGSVLSKLLFLLCWKLYLWSFVQVDDFMVSAQFMDELLTKLRTWRSEMEKKGLRVNMGKTKLMSSGSNFDVLEKSGKYSSDVCQASVGRNAIQCEGCRQWVHKKCSGIKDSLTSDLDFRCARCLGTARFVDGRLAKEVMIGDEKLLVVPKFCYLEDMLSAGGGCELASIERC